MLKSNVGEGKISKAIVMEVDGGGYKVKEHPNYVI